MTVALYLGAHPDDVEIGCGGTIASRMDEDPVVIVLSNCDTNNALGFTGSMIEEEFQNSMEVLGISRYDVFHFRNTEFPAQDKDIRKQIEELRRELQPDVIYLPSVKDPHQDHRTLAIEGIRAFRRGTEEIRGYEISTTPMGFNPVVYVNIEDVMDIKIEALLCYRTQYERSNFDERIFRAQSAFRGAQMGSAYAEGFELIRRCE